jgi:hypothetical protein
MKLISRREILFFVELFFGGIVGDLGVTFILVSLFEF